MTRASTPSTPGIYTTGDGYIHNPMMHGPFQMEATAGLFFLFGDSDVTARLLYAIAGTALVLMPLLFRSRLGDWGALFTSMMLAFSPAMLYYSRFARNDILMAVWALGIVIAMWRYLDEYAKGSQEESSALETDEEEAADPPPKMGNTLYLYITAALLAFAFASKESAYLITATMGLYLVLVIVSRNWDAVRAKVNVGVDSPPVATVKIVGGWISRLDRGLEMRGISKEAGFLVLPDYSYPPSLGGVCQHPPEYPAPRLERTDVGESRGRVGTNRLSCRGWTGRRLPRYGVPDLSCAVLRSEVEYVGLVEGRRDLLWRCTS